MSDVGTITDNRALDITEPLIFEQGAVGRSGVDLPAPPDVASRLGGLERKDAIGLPGLSEPQVVRHYTRLSRNNYGVDTGFYPLGSCTMKHNPRMNERLARLPGFADLHPLQPAPTIQGALQVIDTLALWLKTLTGMPAIAMAPVVLVPDSAHGTNPATAAACGYAVDNVPDAGDGRVDRAALEARLGDDVAAIMLTNPNTCGLFERDIVEIAAATHASGALFYCDGANLNAIMGRVRPGDLGIDAMHFNLHKTFSTPHGGGGPGAGPVALSAELAAFAPLPWVVSGKDGLALAEAGEEVARSLGRLRAFHGQFAVFVRALAYMMSHGGSGLRQVSEDAVLNANYILAGLADVLPPAFPGPCMHEALFDDSSLADTGVTALDIAKALIDEGYHPMTIYFPLVVHGAMLIEPTETESRDTLDAFIATMRALIKKAKAGDTAYFKATPRHAPWRRLDEARAARHPVLRWQEQDGS
jgi:glycine dehydrogenase subunit 2